MVMASVFQTLTTGSPCNGTCWSRQDAPATIGQSGFPPSNSTHTDAPTGGTANSPTPGPAYGTHGSAQLNCPWPSTEGTETRTRPRRVGSTLSTTVPQYLP